jgi:hypothetical protein
MAIGSVIEVRRSLLRGACSLFGFTAPGAGAAGSRTRPRLTREEERLAQATAFLDLHFARHGELIIGPVSLLQRQFDLDYAQALELAAQLEAAHVWSVFRDGCGMRCARQAV